VELQPQSIGGSAPWQNVLSVVRKSQDSSASLYRCRWRSAHDRRRTNAVQFLMNTRSSHTQCRLDSCVSSKKLSGYARLSLLSRVPAKPLSHDRRLPGKDKNDRGTRGGGQRRREIESLISLKPPLPPVRCSLFPTDNFLKKQRNLAEVKHRLRKAP
jgi:hypothetical protein